MTPLSAGSVEQQVVRWKNAGRNCSMMPGTAQGKIRDDVKNKVLVSIGMSSKTRRSKSYKTF